VIDGELVVADKNGHPSFYELRRRCVSTVRKGAAKHPAQVMAFDILAINDMDTRKEPLMVRRTTGPGVMTKRSDSNYRRGKNRDWLKIKTIVGKEREAKRFEDR
jgi:ATP-dependent DNA ligase